MSTIHSIEQGPWGKPKGTGGGPGGGWGSGGGRGRGTPPPGDMGEMWEDIKRQYQRFFGGDGNLRGLWLALAVIFGLWVVSGVYQIQPGEQGVVTRFGKFDRVTSSGLRYHFPSPIEQVVVVNSEAIRLEVMGGKSGISTNNSSGTEDQILMLTGDENIINVSFNVQWKISDPQAFVFNIPDAQRLVQAVSESAMREVIGRTAFNAALTEGKSQVQEEARKLTQETLDNYKAGIQILQVNLRDASFPQRVVAAARDVQAARADQERARNEAQAYANDILPRARGQAERMLQEAEAYKQEIVSKAKGDAARFLSVYHEYRQAEGVTKKRMYLETMEKILTGTNKVILDNKTGALPYLPLPEVRGRSTEKTGEKP